MEAGEQAGLFRLMDANANRVREGLRVMEDIARFVWNEAPLVEATKAVRHDLRAALESLEAGVGLLLAHRDTPGDVGTGLTTTAETDRSDSSALFWANAKRVQEGLRVLEESSKLAGLTGENPFKALRYRAYTLESLAHTTHPGPAPLKEPIA